MNLRPLEPHSSALAKLSYAPKSFMSILHALQPAVNCKNPR